MGGATYGPGEVGQGFVFDGSGQGVQIGSNSANLQLQNFHHRNLDQADQRLDRFLWQRRQWHHLRLWDRVATSSIGKADPEQQFGLLPSWAQHPILGPVITDTNWHHVAVTNQAAP